MTGREAVTVLHLSDPQFGRHHLFGHNGSTEADRDRDSLFARLHKDLRKLRDAEDVRPELVVVSGDLAEWGLRSEFEQVERFLVELAGALELRPRDVVIVPGNHDINRDACEAYFKTCAADEEPPLPPYWPKWKHYVAMFDRFYAGEQGIEFLPTRPWTRFELPELRTVVAGLNSTMAESHQNGDHYGWLGEDQLEDFADWLLPYERRGWLRIGVLHHNVQRAAQLDDENLHDADDLERILGPRLNLLLHGHTHDGKVGRLANGVPILSAGSAAVVAAARPAEVPNQYQILRIARDGVTQLARSYSVGQKRWMGDNRISERGDTWRVFVPAELTGVDATFSTPHGPAGRRFGQPDDRFGGRELYPEPERDRLVDRVEDICRLRETAASVRRHAVPGSRLAYLRVVRGTGAVYPLGVLPELTIEALDTFVERVHRRYLLDDAYVTSHVVYGGSPDREVEEIVATRHAGVRVLSFAEYQYFIDLRGYVAAQTARLAGDGRYPPRLYVPQRYRRLEPGAGHDPAGDDLLSATLGWLAEPDGRFVLVLGDFGHGKSFLLRELARRIPAELPALAPVLVPLRSLERAHGLDALLAAHLAASGERRFDLDGLRYLVREGRVVLLFDGFDELAQRVSYDRAADHLDTLLDAAGGRAKVVVSSRTQHFRSDAQVLTAFGERVQLLPGRRLVELLDFDERQILRFLVNLYGGDEGRARARFATLDDIKDLLGLSRNPRMLCFIARLDDQQLDQARRSGGAITAGALYRLLLEQWLEHEYDRAQPAGAAPTLSVADRWTVVTELALRLWTSTETGVGLTELTTTAGTLAGLAELNLDPDEAAHIVGSATLLTRDDRGTFGFVHQSVMEWLVANHIAGQLAAGGRPEALAARVVSPLMEKFLRDLAGQTVLDEWCARVIEAQITGSADTTSAELDNALRMMEATVRLAQAGAVGGGSPDEVRSTLDLRGSDHSGRNLRGIDLPGVDLSESSLVGTDLADANLRSARLVGVRLDDASLVGADLSDADLTGARLSGADLRGAVLTGATCRRAVFVGAKVDDGAFVDVDVFGAALPGAVPEPQFVGPQGRALALACSPDGALLAIARGSEVRIVDAADRRQLRAMAEPASQILAVAFSPDGRLLASGGEARRVRLWDVATGRIVAVGAGHTDSVHSVAFSADGRWLASAGEDNQVRLLPVVAGQLDATLLADQDGPMRCVTFSQDGRYLAATGDGGRVLVWSTDSWRRLADHVVGPAGTLWSAAFSPDGERLAASGADGWVRLWTVVPGAGDRIELRAAGPEPGYGAAHGGHAGHAYSVAFSPDGRTLSSAGVDGQLLLWDAATGEPAGEPMAGQLGALWTTAFSADGRSLVSTGNDRVVRLWDVEARRLVAEVANGRDDWPRTVRFSPDGRWLATATDDGAARLWDGREGRFTGWPFPDRIGPVWSLAFAPDGTSLAVAGRDAVVRLCDLRAGRHVVAVADGPLGMVWSLAFSPDGRWLAAAGEDHRLKLWNVRDQRLVNHAVPSRSGPVWSVAFSPNSTMLAVAESNGAIRLRRVESRSRSGESLVGHAGPVSTLAFRPDGHLLASGGMDGAVRLWDLDRRRLVGRPLTGHDGGVRSVAFSPDGRWLVSAGDDGPIRLWDLDSRVLAGEPLAGHRGVVRSVAFSPDGRHLASGGEDGTIRIWDFAGRAEVATIVPLTDGHAVLTPDGRYHLTGTAAGEFWYAIGLCRFEPGELDPYFPHLRRLEPDEPVLDLGA